MYTFTPNKPAESSKVNANFSGLADGSEILDDAVTPAKLTSGSGSSWVWQSWTPTFGGFSSDPGGLHYYTRIGKTVTLMIRQTSLGSSNATTFTISLPFQARNLSDARWAGSATVVDVGALLSAPGLISIASDSTVANIYTDWALTGFTATGSKRVVWGQITYEAA